MIVSMSMVMDNHIGINIQEAHMLKTQQIESHHSTH